MFYFVIQQTSCTAGPQSCPFFPPTSPSLLRPGVSVSFTNTSIWQLRSIINGGNCSLSCCRASWPHHPSLLPRLILSLRCPCLCYLQPGQQLERRKGSQQGTLWWSCFNEPVSLSALLVVPEGLQGSLLLYFLKWYQMIAVKTLPGANELLGQHFFCLVYKVY